MAEEKTETRPLNDIMLAMDVVDTLRHQQLLVERELNTEDRDQRMMERLREIYAAQGIEVPDHVLEQGVTALKDGRFVYEPPPGDINTWAAKVYVSRGKWGKPLLIALGVVAVVWFAYTAFISGPAERRIAALPKQLTSQYEQLVDQAQGPLARERARGLLNKGEAALKGENTDAARAVLAEMETLRAEVEREYELRIVSRPEERSGVWRIPPNNPQARNYYIIVEAVTGDGRVLELPIVNEEDGRTRRVSKWGLRVDKELYGRIAADKEDDGIIQKNRFGVKSRGFLTPEYFMPTTGGAITSW